MYKEIIVDGETIKVWPCETGSGFLLSHCEVWMHGIFDSVETTVKAFRLTQNGWYGLSALTRKINAVDAENRLITEKDLEESRLEESNICQLPEPRNDV